MCWVAAAAAAVVVGIGPSAAAAAATHRGPVVIVTLPGVTWHDVRGAHTPALDGLIARGAVATLATRTAVGRPSPERGYLTLGAGSRAFLGPTTKRPEPYAPDPLAEAAYMSSDRVDGASALDALRVRVGDAPNGGVVHLGVAYLQARQLDGLYDARIGAVGDALSRSRIARAVVSAADLAQAPDEQTMRRSSVTSIMDADGTVEVGRLSGLVRDDAAAPYGVHTDAPAFAAAVRTALTRARVVLAEPGETLRADEFAASTAPAAVARMRRAALERADAVLGAVAGALPSDATLLVLAPSPPSYRLAADRLTVMVASGPGVARGWLTSPTTRQAGQVTLTDVGPTVLSMVDAKMPDDMIGRPMSSIRYAGADRLARLDTLDRASVFRERFAVLIFWVIATTVSVLAIGAALVHWRRYDPAYRSLVAVAFAALAFFPAGFLLRTVDYWTFGTVGAHAALYALTAILAFGAAILPGPRLNGAVALLLLSATLFVVDAARAGPLEVNGVWGHSPVVAGRFYGIGNVGSTILYCAAILGLLGLAQLRSHPVAPWWIGAGLAVVVVADGLAQFGADFGGLLTGVAAAAVVFRIGRGRRVTWRWVVVVAVVAVVLTAGASLIDLLRAPQAQTHLGRFAATVRSGGVSSLSLIVRRKAASQFGSFASSRWTFFLPFAIVGLAAVVAAPPGVLRRALAGRRLLVAALAGVVVVGVVGFMVNDSGISITGVALAHAIPVLVLLAADVTSPRAPPDVLRRRDAPLHAPA